MGAPFSIEVAGLGGDLPCTAPHHRPTATSCRRAAAGITLRASAHHAVGLATRARALAARQPESEHQRAF